MELSKSRMRRVNLEEVMEEMENEDEFESGEESDDDSEGEEDSDDWSTDSDDSEESDDEDKVPSTSASPTKHKKQLTARQLDADSSDNEDVERCPICLSRLNGQDIGSPEGCEHNFCLDCIVEWSKNVNTCPVDRRVFHLVMASKSHDRNHVYKRIPVSAPAVEPDIPEESEDRTFCEICGQHSREDRMLLCDACDLGYHCECLNPPVLTIPVGAWFCPTCTRVLGDQAETIEEEMMDNRRPQRQIARTLVSERVRANIARSRGTRGRRIIVSDDESEEESEEESEVEEEEDLDYLNPVMEVVAAVSAAMAARARDGSSASAAAPRKKTTRKRKRKYKKRKTTKKTSAKKTTSSTGTPVKKRRRRTKKRRKKGRKFARVKRDIPTTVKSRLAGRLGLSKPPVGRSIPMVKERVDKSIEWQRSDAGLKSLSILGHKDDLDPFSDWSDDEHMPGYRQLGEAHPSSQIAKLSRAAVKSHAVIRPVRAKASPAKKR